MEMGTALPHRAESNLQLRNFTTRNVDKQMFDNANIHCMIYARIYIIDLIL